MDQPPPRRSRASYLKQAGQLQVKQLRYRLRPPTLPPVCQRSIPYFAQWESPNLVEALIAGKISATDDPNWAQSGATTPEEYALWSWNCCGMACLKMILADTTHQMYPLCQLAKEAATYGCYRQTGNHIDGLYYHPFCRYVTEKFGFAAQAIPALTLSEILTALAQGKYVMLSVTPEIRHPETPPTRRSGHLVLATGYDRSTETLFIHNPSGFYGISQEHAPLSFTRFPHFFDHKGLILQMG